MNAFPWKPRRSDNSPYSAHVVVAVALSTLLVPLMMMRSRVVCLSMQTAGVTAESEPILHGDWRTSVPGTMKVIRSADTARFSVQQCCAPLTLTRNAVRPRNAGNNSSEVRSLDNTTV